MKRFGILIIALFGVAGCDRDSRYFCIADGPLSERGCFLCRGDECDPQPAPQRGLCATDVDCAVGEVCTTLGCVAECNEEYDCPIGTTCADSGHCVNPLEDQPDAPEHPPTLRDRVTNLLVAPDTPLEVELPVNVTFAEP